MLEFQVAALLALMEPTGVGMQRISSVGMIFLVGLIVVFGSYQVGYFSATGRLSASPAVAASQATPSIDQRQGFDTFSEVWQLLQREFYNKDALDDRKMTYGAIRGMLATLDDQHTTFVDPKHAQMSEDEMRGAFDGIGVTVEMRDKRLTVVAPLDDSPGERAGLKAGDAIVSVDGKDTAGLDISQGVALIRGPRGTTVQLTVERAGEPEQLHFEIVRAEIKTVTVKGKMIDDIGYVKVTQFSEPTPTILRQRLGEVMANNPKAIVLDLRNNPGGLLESAIGVASQFIGEGVVMYEQRRDAAMQAFFSRKGGLATEVPIVVLINNGSASASEIVAGALQDTGRGVLVGEHTFGKDTVQNVHQLSDRSSVRITIARWLTPAKQEISGKGLLPDVQVSLTEDDAKAGRDAQLDRALAIAHGQ